MARGEAPPKEGPSLGAGRIVGEGGQGEAVQRAHRGADQEEAGQVQGTTRRDGRGVSDKHLEGDQEGG